MAISDFDKTRFSNQEYILNDICTRHIDGKLLLTTDCGGWAILDKNEYDLLIRYELSDELFKLLEEKCIIITQANLRRIVELQQNRLSFLFRGVSLHILVSTLRCNQKCIYCHSSAMNSGKKEYDMNADTAKKILEFIFQSPSKILTIEFQGGETSLNPDLLKCVVNTAKEMNKTHQKNIGFSLVTNLTQISTDIIDWLVAEGVGICTSLDGPKEVHDSNRKYENGSGTHDDVINMLNLTKKVHGKQVAALMVTTRQSLPYWKEIIDEYVKTGIPEIQIKYINKLGFAQNSWQQIEYTIEEFIEFWQKSMDYIIELNKKGVNIRERYASFIMKKLLTTRDPSFLDFRNPCGIVSGQLAYNYNGDIYCCDEGRNYEIFNLGNVFTSKLTDVMLSEQSRQLIQSSMLENYACDNCAYKPYCGTCPVINYAETGNIIPNLSTNSKCKLHKAQFDYIFRKLLDKDSRKILFGWVR